jgi:hypothetical protein
MDYKSFTEFYHYYLNEHSHMVCRQMHFLGTSGVIALLILFFFTGKLFLLGILPFVRYGFSWIGHLFFEKNRPLTFRHPLYVLGGDLRMFWEILTGRIKAF